MFIASVLLALATCLPLAKAHGSASGAFIDDVYYPAPNPNGDSGQYTIRAINNINPVKGADNPALNCGHNAQKAALVADARPGSILRFAWMNGELGPWVHNTGPVISYMASCGSGGCVNFDSANAQWFKVSQYGRKEDGSGWYMADITGEHNRTLPVTLPSNLPAGEYLFRHELIAMQLGMSPGGAEFYPSCMQIRLSGPEITSSELPSGSSVVTFPGGYSDSDPGITDPHVYDPGFPYTFPGPALISDTVTSEEPSEPASEVPAATTTEGTPTSSESAAPSPSSAPCNGRKAKRSTKRVVKRVFRQGPLIKKTHKRQVSKPVAQKRDEPSYPVARSRVMRGI